MTRRSFPIILLDIKIKQIIAILGRAWFMLRHDRYAWWRDGLADALISLAKALIGAQQR
jgi:hypothetical protein